MVDQTSQFYAILTDVGAAKQANADALGIAWTFSQMGVGDGNPTGLDDPALPMPNSSQKALLNEWRRAPLNQLKVDPNNAAVIIAEQIIPADVGGKWIREIALYDSDGDMVAVANCPPTFKPLMSQGSGRTQVLRLNLLVKSASNVQLKIDPSVVLATREWVTEELARQDFKYSVLAATTAPITLSGLQTVDGVPLTAGARVLVKNQAAAKGNGLYLVVAGGAWTRCTDADASAKVTPGMLVLVERGTANGDSAWQLVTDAPITLGVTALAFEMAFGRTGVAAGTYRSVTVDAYGRVTAASNPTTVSGYGLTDVYTKTQIDQALALKSPLDSPSFTGDPKVPTPAVDDNDTSAANTAFVMRALGLAGFGPQSTAYSLAAGVDLNTMKAGGSYGQASNGGATLALNYPVALAGTLLVLTAGTSVVTQIYTVRGTGLSYIRSYYATWSAWALIWDASNTPKQSNLTDKTSGAMLTVGSFGVGAGLLSTEKDMNNYVIPGNYTTPIVGLLNLPEGWPVTHRYVVVVEGFSNENYLIQRITGGLANGHAPLYAKRTMSSSGTWTPWRDEWHSGNTPKQTSPTDITPGAMLTVGSFGWGGSAVAFSGDMDALAVSGIYMIGITTTGTKPENAGAVIPNGTLEHIERGSSKMATQRWDSLIGSTSPMSFIRTKNSSGVWSAWELVITEKHLPCRGKVYYRSAGVYQWTVPAGVYKVDVEVRGAGGSGGFGTQEVGSGGGGGGGISKRLCNVVPGSVITITVGAGGAAASAAGASGNAGTASAFGTFCSATGGAGGSSGSGAAGGYGAGGDINMSMGSGSPALRNAPGTYALGGAGGGGESIFATSNSTTPTQPGMGGGGRTSNQSQPGADGCVFITY